MIVYAQEQISHSNEEKLALQIINELRRQKGLTELQLMDSLTKLSDVEVKTMSNNVNAFIQKIKTADLQSVFNYYNIGYCKNIFYNIVQNNDSLTNIVNSWLNKQDSPFLMNNITHFSLSHINKNNVNYYFCFAVERNKDLSNDELLNYKRKVIELVNVERAKYNLTPLSELQFLMEASQIRATEQLQKEGHTRPNNTPWNTVLKLNGAYHIGENVAQGQSTPEEVMKDWMNSPEHRENILKVDYKYIGVGVYQKDGKFYWAQLFYNNKS